MIAESQAGLLAAVQQDEEHTRSLTAFLSPAQAPDELGRLGTYRILKILGSGGMGVVDRAEDPQLKRIVALKAMLPELAASSGAKIRFLREAQAVAGIKHDHIVTIHQVGEDRGIPYLAMEFLQGESLDDRIKREGKLPAREVLRIGREIADGLEAAHEEHLIHRDIRKRSITNRWASSGRKSKRLESRNEFCPPFLRENGNCHIKVSSIRRSLIRNRSRAR